MTYRVSNKLASWGKTPTISRIFFFPKKRLFQKKISPSMKVSDIFIKEFKRELIEVPSEILDRFYTLLVQLFPTQTMFISNVFKKIRTEFLKWATENRKKVSVVVKLTVLALFSLLIVVGSNGIACIPAAPGVIAGLSAAFAKGFEDTIDTMTENFIRSIGVGEKKKLLPQGTARCFEKWLKKVQTKRSSRYTGSERWRIIKVRRKVRSCIASDW